MGRRSAITRLVASFVAETRKALSSISPMRGRAGARCGCMRIPDEGRVAEALRVLADFDCLFVRYYGRDQQHDFHIA